MSNYTTRKLFWILFAILMLTTIPFLGDYDFNTKGEPREAIIPYTMLETGNWILPQNNGGDIPYKPPFLHWCIAAVSIISGQVNEFTSRFPSAIALILMSLFGFLFYAKRRNSEVAFVAAIVTFTATEIQREGVNCRVDMMLTFLIVSSLFAFYKWYESGMRHLPYLPILLMSLATLTKGPVGILLPCLVMGFFLLVKGIRFSRAFTVLAVSAILSLILPALWYIAAYRQGGQVFLDLVLEENLGRMTGTMSYESHVHSWPYNIGMILSGMLPWTLLVLFSLFGLRKFKDYMSLTHQDTETEEDALNDDEEDEERTGIKSYWNRAAEWLQGLPDVDIFTMFAAVIIFVFYCIPSSKRGAYLMPVYPFASYFIARYMFWLVNMRSKSIKIYGGVLSVIGLLLPILLIVIKTGIIPDTVFHGKHAVENVAMMHNIAETGNLRDLILMSITTVTCLYWWRMAGRKYSSGHVFAISALVVCIWFSINGVYKSPVMNAKSKKHLAAQIDRIAPESSGKMYEFMEAAMHSAGDMPHFFELNFYMRNRIGNFYRERPKSGYLLISPKDAEKYIPEFESHNYRFSLIYDPNVPNDIKAPQLYKFEKNV